MVVLQNLIDLFFELITIGFSFEPFVLLCITFFLFCVISCSFKYLFYGKY